ncbi:phage holin family protein [Gaiella sp.]|uniref:phage holin family protein n=1 Tax=Gaiella sp. TaxID=2663207 RepID=UPI002E352516|nr:phage holin family protein [Gaiella sp.]HEX5584771.1 phage holin family protein [Gaiella sp.]
MPDATTTTHGHAPQRADVRPQLRVTRLVVSLVVNAISVFVAAWILPGLEVGDFWRALLAAAVIGVLNAVLSPLVAAVRLPYTVATSFLLVLVLDAVILMLTDAATDQAIRVDGFGWALVAAVLISAIATVLDILVGADDDDAYTLRVIHRIARRSGERVVTDEPGILYLEVDGLAKPILQRAMRDGNAPQMASWLAQGTHRLVEWETDLSSQTGASQAGILLGSNEDVPAFRWVEKERGELMVCSNPDDCAEIERRHAGDGLLRDGGASRGNLLSGEAEHVLLTASRVSEEKKANPGYRAFFSNGFNVTRTLALVGWEVILELVAAERQRRRDVLPRGHRGGIYPLLRAGMCVLVRDLTVFAVLTDMFKGRPAIYATFASYDEVAHHSGLERPDTLEALRKLDQQFGRIERARRYASRPYHLVVLSDHGQTQGTTFKQRNGYALEDLVRDSVEARTVHAVSGEDESRTNVGVAFDEATGQGEQSGGKRSPKKDVSGQEVVVLGSGNLGLVYLMDEPRRLTREEIDERHPRLLPALQAHPHVGFVLVRSEEHGAVVLGPSGARYLADDRVEGDDPLTPFSAGAAGHLRRSDGFAHAPDLYVNSFYDPELDEGCAFEELISFHGGMGGPQTRPFVLAPVELPLPDEPLVGAASIHRLLKGWRDGAAPTG